MFTYYVCFTNGLLKQNNDFLKTLNNALLQHKSELQFNFNHDLTKKNTF